MPLSFFPSTSFVLYASNSLSPCHNTQAITTLPFFVALIVYAEGEESRDDRPTNPSFRPHHLTLKLSSPLH